MTELYEKLAAIQHDIWAHWMKYLFSVSPGGEISPENYKRWTTQLNTHYTDLTEKEKDSDREQVDKYWPLIDTKAELETCCQLLIKNGISTGHGSSFTDLVEECIRNVLEARAKVEVGNECT